MKTLSAALIFSWAVLAIALAASARESRPPAYVSFQNGYSSASSSIAGVAATVIDANHDGVPEEIEYSDATVTLRKSIPYEGRYHLIEIERRTPQGLVSSRLFYSGRLGRYVVHDISRRAYRMMRKSADDCPDQIGAPNPISDFKEILKKLKDRDLPVTQAIDHSCSQPPFAANREAMEAGLFRVADSSGAKQGPFLSCLRRRGLESVAVKFEKMLAQMVTASSPSLRCEYQPKSPSYAGFDETSSQAITFYHTRFKNGPDADPTFFARVFFHEGLHKSGYPDEGFVFAAENCCNDDGASNPKSCDSMIDIARRKHIVDAYLAAMEKTVGPELKELLPRLRTVEEKEAFNRMLVEYFEQVDQYAALGTQPDQVFKHCMSSKRANGEVVASNRDREKSCLDSTVNRAAVDIERFVGEQCSHYFKEENRERKCSAIKAAGRQLLEKSARAKCSESGSALEDSCLFKGFRDARNMRTGQLDALALERFEAKAKAYEPTEIKARTDLLSSYLTAFSQNLDGIGDYWESLKQEEDPHLAESMVASFFESIPHESEQTDRRFEACVKANSTKGVVEASGYCAQEGYKDVRGFIRNWFDSSCPRFFKADEATAKCALHEQRLVDVIDRNVHGGCQLAGPAKGVNLSCLNASLAQARNYQRLEAFVDPDTRRSIFERKWFDQAYQDKREAARIVQQKLSEEKSQGSRMAVHESEPTEVTHSIAFDPRSASSLREKLNAQASSSQPPVELEKARQELNGVKRWAEFAFRAAVPTANAAGLDAPRLAVNVPIQTSGVPGQNSPAPLKTSSPQLERAVASVRSAEPRSMQKAEATSASGLASEQQRSRMAHVRPSSAVSSSPGSSSPLQTNTSTPATGAQNMRSGSESGRAGVDVQRIIDLLSSSPQEAIEALKSLRGDPRLRSQMAARKIRIKWGSVEDEAVGADKPQVIYVFEHGRFKKVIRRTEDAP
jgi:hypothetical protein